MNEETRKSYDLVAADYAENFRDELAEKPFDRKMLDWLFEKVGDAGTICDMGCGPGQIAGYLAEKGTRVCGVDLSGKMVEEAEKLNPAIEFLQGDMMNLEAIGDDAFGGIAAFYSIIHVPRTELNKAFDEFRRVLRPNGVLLVAFHIGRETVQMEEWFEKKVALDFNFLETTEIKENLTASGFKLEEIIEREPYPEIEYQSRRAYIFAGKK